MGKQIDGFVWEFVTIALILWHLKSEENSQKQNKIE